MDDRQQLSHKIFSNEKSGPHIEAIQLEFV